MSKGGVARRGAGRRRQVASWLREAWLWLAGVRGRAGLGGQANCAHGSGRGGRLPRRRARPLVARLYGLVPEVLLPACGGLVARGRRSSALVSLLSLAGPAAPASEPGQRCRWSRPVPLPRARPEPKHYRPIHALFHHHGCTGTSQVSRLPAGRPLVDVRYLAPPWARRRRPFSGRVCALNRSGHACALDRDGRAIECSRGRY